jgi:hypothetical protein
LLVALLLLSTAVYVIETERNVPIVGNSEVDVFSTYKQSARNTLISALANVTRGGDVSVLSTDLNQLNLVITSDSYQAMLKMDYTMQNTDSYKNGFWISWGTDGHGVSSDYVSFAFNSLGLSTTSNLVYIVNVTSEAYLSGTYLQLNDTTKQATLKVNLLNEGKPATAQNFTFYFLNESNWIKTAVPYMTDYGNGTYEALFVAEQSQTSNSFVVSMLCQDQRGIFVGANATCPRIG